MYIKMYRYTIRDDQIETYLAIQRKAGKIHSKYRCKSFHLKCDEDTSVWIEIHHYQDKEHYLKAIAEVNAHDEIHQLYEEFLKVLVPESNMIEEDFTVIDIV